MIAHLIATLLLADAKPPADLPKCPSDSDTPDVVSLMQRTERLLEGGSSIAVMAMTIKTSWPLGVRMKACTLHAFRTAPTESIPPGATSGSGPSRAWPSNATLNSKGVGASTSEGRRWRR